MIANRTTAKQTLGVDMKFEPFEEGKTKRGMRIIMVIELGEAPDNTKWTMSEEKRQTIYEDEMRQPAGLSVETI